MPAPKAPAAASGLLSLTKGGQPVIGGRMLNSDTMAKFFGEDWRNLEGRRFRVYGESRDHACGPRAQCLTSGVIPLVRNVVSIELCEGCNKTPAGVRAVKCPVSEDDKRGCLAICDDRGETCRNRVAGNPAHTQRCDSQLGGCRKGCLLHGEPDPYCG